MRIVYEGSIAVARDDYLHPDEDGERVEVEGLDQRVTETPILRFTLDYPFERPYEGSVVSDAGPTLRQIIDAIRVAYRTIYRGTTAEEIPNLDNMHVQGDFGEAFHVIDDLVIERISIDESAGRLDIFIGS